VGARARACVLAVLRIRIPGICRQLDKTCKI